MQRRGHVKVISRSWVKSLRRAVDRSTLHDGQNEPGLTHIDSTDEVDGIRWYSIGPAEADLTVVFIHGYGLSAESFYSQVSFLRQEFPRVRSVLLDLRGHGQSCLAAAEDCTIDDAADDVMRIISTVTSGDLVIVGHSLGGMIAQNVVRRMSPDIFARIRSVFLIATSMQPFATTGAAALLRSHAAGALYNAAQRLPDKINRIRRGLAEILAPVFAALLTGFPQMEKLQFHVDMLLDTPLDSYVGFFDDLIDHCEYSAAARLSQLPGVIMVGTMDIVTPKSQSEEILSHWPGAKLVEVEGAGHMVILEEPEEVATALRDVVEQALRR